MKRRSEADKAHVALNDEDMANLHFKPLGIFKADHTTKGFLQHCCWLWRPSFVALGVRCGAPPILWLLANASPTPSPFLPNAFPPVPDPAGFHTLPQCPHPSSGASGSRMLTLAANLVAIHQPQCQLCPSVPSAFSNADM